jgi:diguanylate cyclase (GGDEF)-like protein
MVRLLSAVASQMGIAINNARLFENTKKSSLHDALTGLANRRFMEIEFAKRLETAKRYREALSIIMLDIDHFKNYNDTHGHQEGDGLLVKLADILLQQVRKTDYVFRYGGEEFLVILPKMGLDMAHETAERLRRAVEAEGEGITISLGVVSLNEGLQEKDTLIGAADKALYRAKANGRNRVAVG